MKEVNFGQPSQNFIYLIGFSSKNVKNIKNFIVFRTLNFEALFKKYVFFKDYLHKVGR